MNTIINIEGMSCNHCVKHVTETLSAITGVKSVSVSLENKNAAIEHDGSVSFETLKKAVEEAGFDAV